MDKLFKDKLENHSIPPAPQSWEKVEARISKKNNRAIVMRVAAGIAVVGLLLTLLFSQREQANPSTLAKEDIKQTPPATSNELPATPIESSDHVASSQHEKTHIVTQRERFAKKIIEPEATQTTELVVNVIERSDPTAPGSRPTAPSGRTTELIEPEPSRKKTMVLVYTLPSPGKKVETPVAVAEEERKTGLQKVMDVAMDVRSSDSPLGELREKKDELFAFEFRKEKKSKN